MEDKYHVEVTSRDSAEVDDIPLTPPEEDKGTRRIIRPKIVNNVNEAAASVQVELLHQRRHKKNEPWQDAESFSLATLKAGQEVRLTLGATEAWRLKEALNQLYAIGQNGVPPQSMDFVAVPAQNLADSVIVKGDAKQVLETLQEQHGEKMWAALAELNSNLLETIALQKLREKRRTVVEQFRTQLERKTANEPQWQKFFSKNPWIFGHGLDYRILNLVEEQPHYGGTTMSGKGGQRGDYLMATNAGVSFTVIVDIKTPQAQLVELDPYRNKVHKVGPDVAGGVAQLQSYCHTWSTKGSQDIENVLPLAEQNICTYEPKSILVIGDTVQLDNLHKKASFEMFRRNLHNPEILTFDELLARAEYLVESPETP